MAEPHPSGEPLLRVDGLVKHYQSETHGLFGRRADPVKAVDGVSFELRAGETLGIVGESGCGKSTVAKTLLRLVEPDAGSAVFDGRDLFSLGNDTMRQLRKRIQIVFQDPFASLNPRMRVGQIVGEPFEVFPEVLPKSERAQRVADLLERVGLHASDANRHPHQFSGGQRQRIGIARALALEPALIVCDEPVSALDVSVQAQVINLLESIQRDTGVAYLFIAHNLAVVRHLSHRVAVMYLGRIVETGTEADIYQRASHPYTQALLSAVPSPHRKRQRLLPESDSPGSTIPPSGCRFRTRCWKAEEICAREEPALVDRPGIGHPSACHFSAHAEHGTVAGSGSPAAEPGRSGEAPG